LFPTDQHLVAVAGCGRRLARIVHEAGRSKGQHGLSGNDRHRRPSPYGMAGELSGLAPAPPAASGCKAALSGNRASNSGSDRSSSAFPFPFLRAHTGLGTNLLWLYPTPCRRRDGVGTVRCGVRRLVTLDGPMPSMGRGRGIRQDFPRPVSGTTYGAAGARGVSHKDDIHFFIPPGSAAQLETCDLVLRLAKNPAAAHGYTEPASAKRTTCTGFRWGRALASRTMRAHTPVGCGMVGSLHW